MLLHRITKKMSSHCEQGINIPVIYKLAKLDESFF